jgi:hypothetical protein
MFRTALKSPTIGVTILIALGCSGNGGASDDGENSISGILTGEIQQVTESVGIFVWGDGVNQLCQQWSVARNDQSGWFYGTRNPTSSADTYVLAAPNDPFSVVAAESFNYTTDTVEAHEGDTVFFRGRNGFFGAWTITEVSGSDGAVLSGNWYFKAGGGGDFTGAIVAGGSSDYDANVGVCDGY